MHQDIVFGCRGERSHLGLAHVPRIGRVEVEVSNDGGQECARRVPDPVGAQQFGPRVEGGVAGEAGESLGPDDDGHRVAPFPESGAPCPEIKRRPPARPDSVWVLLDQGVPDDWDGDVDVIAVVFEVVFFKDAQCP